MYVLRSKTLSPRADRIPPVCRHAANVAGARASSSDAAASLKKSILKDALARRNLSDIEIRDTIVIPQTRRVNWL